MAGKRKKAKKAPQRKPAKKTTALAVVEQRERDLRELKIPRAVLDDPRKSRFLYVYYSRESGTYGNMKQSALVAGFSKEYADNLSHLRPKWLSDFIGQSDIALLAEEHLREVMMLPSIGQAMGAFGPIFRTEATKMRVKQKNGKFKTKTVKNKVPVLVPLVNIIKEKTAAAKLILPAHDPKYKKDNAPKFSFHYSVKEVREQFKPS